MVMEITSMITTMKVTIMTMLFVSMFCLQGTTLPYKSGPNLNFGALHDKKFEYTHKSSLLFSSVLKSSALLSLMPLFLKVKFKTPETMVSVTEWLPKNTHLINLELRFDLSFKLFFSVALFVSWSILEFSHYYMAQDPAPNKFFRLLMIFLLKMIMLTSTENVFLLFMGWEGVGFLSFLLMSWWTTRASAKKSALQAMIYNRMGDMGILLFFSLSVTTFNSWTLSEMFILQPSGSLSNILLVGALMAAAGKSAQFGLHPWLPAAMEGPTPVSALLHSSTMVVAGMFLLIRLGPVYSNVKTFKTWCLMLGSITAMFAATTAISQHDMKKMMAYSTTSQLGLMMVAMGLNQPEIALFHICTHAFFKAMLFLSSGSIIHSLKDEQDMRKMGGLHLMLPNTTACIILGSLALSGTPFLAGFYSKDLMLELGLSKLSNLMGIVLALLATLLTAAYSFRIMHFCFTKSPAFSPLSPTSEEKIKLTKALKRLAIGTMISGWMMSNFILQPPKITISLTLKSLAALLTVSGMVLTASLLRTLSLKMPPKNLMNAKTFTTKQWFYEHASHNILTSLSFSLSLTGSTQSMDRGWSENLGAQGMNSASSEISREYQLTQTGYIKQYLLLSTTTFTIMAMASTTFL